MPPKKYDRAISIFLYILSVDPMKENVFLQMNRNLSLLFLLREDSGEKNQMKYKLDNFIAKLTLSRKDILFAKYF